MPISEQAHPNRTYWDEQAEEHEPPHGLQLTVADPVRATSSTTDDELRVLGLRWERTCSSSARAQRSTMDCLDVRLHRSSIELGQAGEADPAATRVTTAARNRLLRPSGLDREALLELRPPSNTTTIDDEFVPLDRCGRWSGEHLWKARKR